jgi:hypothetical protein
MDGRDKNHVGFPHLHKALAITPHQPQSNAP